MKIKVSILCLIIVVACLAGSFMVVNKVSAQPSLLNDTPVGDAAPIPDDYQFNVSGVDHAVVGIRPETGDNFDIEVYTDTTFTTLIDSSTYAGDVVDFVVLDKNIHASPPNRSARVVLGTTSYVIEMENDVPDRNLTSPWNASIDAPGGVVEVLDAFELNNATIDKVYSIHLTVPTTLDLDFFIFNSTGDRSDAIAYSINIGAGINESTGFKAPIAGDYLLVITNENNGTGNYTVIPNNLPIVQAGQNQTVNEGDTVGFTGNFTEGDFNNNFTYVWDFGDGTNTSGTINGTMNLLTNGNFTDGLTGWNTSVEAPATTTLQVIPSDGTFDNVLEIDNPINDGDGDWDWAYQDLYYNVTNYSVLYFEANGKAIYQSLSDDGFVGGEYPVHFSIRYRDVNGTWRNGMIMSNPWQQGFYYLGTGTYPYSNKVAQNVWFHYKSSNLMELDPRPQVIGRVRVGASGWAYHGMIDNVRLYGYNFTTIMADHTYGDNGVFNATLSIIDDDGGVGIDSLMVTVNNIAPSGDIGGPYASNEGTAINFTGSATDPGSDDLIFNWSWDDGTAHTENIHYNDGANPDPYPSTAGIYPFSEMDAVQHVYDDGGLYTVTLTVSDDDGGSVVYTITVTVYDAPVIDNVSTDPSPQIVGRNVTISATVTDTDTDMAELTVTVLITKPDGSLLGNYTMTYDPGSDRFTYTSSFDITGTYNLVIWAIDPESNVDRAEGSLIMEELPAEEFNWKPIIALIFTIILLIFGLWASYKRPIRFTGILKKDRRKTFIAGVIPFIIAEITTGIVSLLTGILCIPPVLDIGLVVDLIILILGIITSIVILRKGVDPKMYEKVERPSESPPPPLPPPPPP